MGGVGLALLLLLSAGGSGQSGSEGPSGQVMIQPTESVLAAATLSETATLDIVGTPLTGIRMNRNSTTGKFEATVAGVPVGTWTFRVTYRDKNKNVTAKAGGKGTVTANTVTIVLLTTLTFPATDVVAGSNHNCALLTNKTVSCWGANGFGQLGNGTVTSSSSPVKVLVLDDVEDVDVEKVAAGSAHSCARLTNGSVWCWGENSAGQLGDGTTTRRLTPVKVEGIATATAIAAGSNHSCAVVNTETVSCWGLNGNGQLGNGVTLTSASPLAVLRLTTATNVAAGSDHNCARLTDKTVWCWGNNSSGQLGNGTTTSSSSPVKVSDLKAADAVAAGSSHSCALLTDKTVRCWGDNSLGQLGDGMTTSSSIPVTVLTKGDEDPLTGATAVAAGRAHSCARLTTGTVRCWGYNGSGRLGDDTTKLRRTSVVVKGIETATAVAAGRAHSCARLNDGSVFCWGQNNAGQLGNGNDMSSKFPVMPVFNLTTATDRIAAGSDHSCAPLSSSTVRCWGNNVSGQLGDGTTNESSIPVPVLNLTTATGVAAGSAHSCAHLITGSVFCWGSNSFGQLGSGAIFVSPLPVQVDGIP